MAKIDLTQRVKSFWFYENTFGVINSNDYTIIAIGEYNDMYKICEKRNYEDPNNIYEVVRLSDNCSTMFKEYE